MKKFFKSQRGRRTAENFAVSFPSFLSSCRLLPHRLRQKRDALNSPKTAHSAFYDRSAPVLRQFSTSSTT